MYDPSLSMCLLKKDFMMQVSIFPLKLHSEYKTAF